MQPYTMLEVTVVLYCTSTGKELRQRIKVPETVADLQSFIQARFNIPKCLQKLKFEDATLLVGSQKLTDLYIRNEDSIIVEYSATAEIERITNLCRHLHSVIVNFREFLEADDHLEGYSSISDEGKSAVEQVRGLLHTVAYSCLVPWHQVPKIEANRQFLNQEDGVKLTIELLSLLLEAPFHSLADPLQLLLIACLSLLWNFAETRASRLAVVQLGGFQLMMKALLVHSNDHSSHNSEMFDLFGHAVGCISNYSEIEECQLQLAQSSAALDLLLSFAIDGSLMDVFTKMLIANCVFRLSHNTAVHPHLCHPDVLEKILQFFTTFEKILGLTYYNMVVGYVLSVALARLVLLSLEVVPDRFQSRIVKLLDSFLAKAKAAGSISISAAEEKLQCNWLTMVPFVDVFMVPLHAASHDQEDNMPSITQSSLSVMMFALTVEMSRKCNRELMIQQGLLDFIVSLPWSIPDKWRENSKSVVLVFQKDFQYLPVPKLYSIAAACAAKHGLHIPEYYIKRWKVVATMIVIFSVSIIFTAAEGVLEFLDLHELPCSEYKFFTHGGMVFLFSTSIAFSIAYLLTFLIYLCGCHQRLNLPSKKSFYRYALFLSLVNVVQAIGSFLWYFGRKSPRGGNAGICLTVITNLIYVGTFAPMVYWIFLSNYFRMNKDLKEAANRENRINVAAKDQADSSVFSHTSSSNPLHIAHKGHSRYGDQTSLIPESYGSVSSYGSVDDEEMFNRLTPDFVK